MGLNISQPSFEQREPKAEKTPRKSRILERNIESGKGELKESKQQN